MASAAESVGSASTTNAAGSIPVIASSRDVSAATGPGPLSQAAPARPIATPPPDPLPTASVGPSAAGSSIGTVVTPRARRTGNASPSTTRTTDSTIGEVAPSRSNDASASSGPTASPTGSLTSRCSPPDLPAATNRSAGTGVPGNRMPRWVRPGATSVAAGERRCRRSSTIGRSGLVRSSVSAASASTTCATTSIDAAINANGRSPARSRWRKAWTAAAFVASQVSRRPPTPEISTMAPAASACRAAATGSPNTAARSAFRTKRTDEAAFLPPLPRLPTSPPLPPAGASTDVTDSMRASGGGAVRSRRANSPRAAGEPATVTVSPPSATGAPDSTAQVKPSSVAHSCKKAGRHPVGHTPRTVNRSARDRTSPGSVAVSMTNLPAVDPLEHGSGFLVTPR